MDEDTYKNGFLGEIEKRITDEIDHIKPATREHVLRIVDEVARTYVPVGNLPSAPIHDNDYYGCDMRPKLDNELLSQLVSKDATFAWKNITDLGEPFDGIW